MIKSFVCFFFLFPVLFSGLPLGLWALDSAGKENPQSSGNALNRLIEISGQLSALNERLHSELQDSRQSSRELQTMLEASRKELGELRRELGVLKQELEVLQSTSTELRIAAENSQRELTGLQTALRKAESSLASLELSFAAYRQAAEKRISSLERQNRLWKWGCIAAGILSVGFGTAFLAGR